LDGLDRPFNAEAAEDAQRAAENRQEVTKGALVSRSARLVDGSDIDRDFGESAVDQDGAREREHARPTTG